MKKQIYKSYHQNGNLDFEYEYNSKYRRNGYYIAYWIGGNIRVKSQYKNNIRYGMSEWFYKSGLKYEELIIY